MSMSPSGAVQPKRKRGHLRVAAIMEAGAQVFSEKGFDAATMSEIATRSGTATGSLYRFFPSKESLADALLVRYAKYYLGELAELRVRVSEMSLQEVAGALVDLRLKLQSQRAFVVDLADEHAAGSEDRRSRFRKAILGAVGRILREVIPGLTRSGADAVATVILHILKGVSAVGSQKPVAGQALLAEFKELLYAYLSSVRLSGAKHTSG
jgi:AcrR family transcriptional regulator